MKFNGWILKHKNTGKVLTWGEFEMRGPLLDPEPVFWRTRKTARRDKRDLCKDEYKIIKAVVTYKEVA